MHIGFSAVYSSGIIRVLECAHTAKEGFPYSEEDPFFGAMPILGSNKQFLVCRVCSSLSPSNLVSLHRLPGTQMQQRDGLALLEDWTSFL